MADKGGRFRDAIINEIQSWKEQITVLKEKPVGFRFVNTARTLDIVLKHADKYLGIEAKYQETEGTTYKTWSYALEDCLSCPIPTIIVFASKGKVVKDDMKSKLILSGIGIEVNFDPHEKDAKFDRIIDRNRLFQQRVYIELGLDWFKLYK